MQGESGKSQMAPQMALGHRVPRGNGPGVPGSPRTNPFKFTRGDRSFVDACRRMPKSKEAQARATKALREKRAKLKEDALAQEALDAAGKTACAACKKHIADYVALQMDFLAAKELV